MSQNLKPELVATAETQGALAAVVAAGADAVCLRGKRMQGKFANEMIKNAVEFAHEKNARIYADVNGLIEEGELPELRDFLLFLSEEAKPDAILLHDFAVLDLARELGIKIPLHASVMMNTHNAAAAKKLKEAGVARVALGSEMTLAEAALLRREANIETEYAVHGEMCVAERGQCIRSGVLFGQSGNRGCCLMPCRYKYRLVNEETGRTIGKQDTGRCRLSLKDLCLLEHLPHVLAADVRAVKIEGAGRPAEIMARTVAAYREAIDAYYEEGAAWRVNEEARQSLWQSRTRDFTAGFAFGKSAANMFDVEGEPRVFTKPIKEAGLDGKVLHREMPLEKKFAAGALLTVRVADYHSAKGAIVSGANIVYMGGETFLPQKPPTLDEFARMTEFAHKWGAKLVVATPRTTTRRECDELRIFLPKVAALGVDGVLAGNLGALKIAYDSTDLPLNADISFNVTNSRAVNFLAQQGVTMVAASLELPFAKLRDALSNSVLPVEVVVHGANTAMLCDHEFLPPPEDGAKNAAHTPLALKDSADEVHPLRCDQYGRTHILFARDLCLYPYIKKFFGAAAIRIEARDYSPRLVAVVTKAYRDALDELETSKERFAAIVAESPRKLGVGVYRFV